MKLTILIFLSIFNIQLSFADIGDPERGFLTVKEYDPSFDKNRHQIQCKNKESMLDSVGCLQAGNRIAKNCTVVEDHSPLPFGSPCPEKMDTIYKCDDYAICREKETSTIREINHKKPKQNTLNESVK